MQRGPAGSACGGGTVNSRDGALAGLQGTVQQHALRRRTLRFHGVMQTDARFF